MVGRILIYCILFLNNIIYCINITDRRKIENSVFFSQCDRYTAVSRLTGWLDIAKTLNEMWILINKGRVRLVISVSLFSYGWTALVALGILVEVWRSSVRHATFRRNSLDEWSAGRRDLYLTTHNTHSRQTSMQAVEFEPTILPSERSQTHALDRAATETGLQCLHLADQFLCT